MDDEIIDRPEPDEQIPFENITGKETEGMPELFVFVLCDPDSHIKSISQPKREMTQMEADDLNNCLKTDGLKYRWINNEWLENYELN